MIGSYAFLIGVILAIVAGAGGTLIADYLPHITLLLVILGLIVGLLNVTDKEVVPFLIATIALMVVGSTTFIVLDGLFPGLGSVIQGIVNEIAVFVAPAAVILALKSVYNLAKFGESK